MTLSRKSLDRLMTCHPDLVALVKWLSERWDLVVIEGHRSEARQAQLFAEGRTKVRKGGKHNHRPSKAVDIAPLTDDGRIDWEATEEFEELGKAAYQWARANGVRLRWGGDWSGGWWGKGCEGRRPAQRFDDLVHFELSDPP